MNILKNKQENTERILDNDLLKTLIEKVIDNKLKNSQIWVPAIVKSFDNVKKTITIKEFFPIKDCDTLPDYYIALNQINDKYFANYEIPFVSLSTGTFEFSIPIQTGDTVIVLFTLSNINCWQKGKTIDPKYWFFAPNNAVAIPCIFNLSQIQTRSTLFNENGAALPPNNVHLMYKNSHIEFTDNNVTNITAQQLNINSNTTCQINSSNLSIGNTVKIATTQGVDILQNILNQLQSITQALTNIQAAPMAPPIAPQIATLNTYIAQLQTALS